LAWALLEHFVPAHPIERSGASLLLAVALVCATGAQLMASAPARQITTLAAFVLLLVLFLRL
jgi:hypothetical protein